MENLISLSEWARMNGIQPDTARQKALRGGFRTARKIGRNWVISKNEPNIDKRKKEGVKVVRKRIYFVMTNGYNMLVSVDEDKKVRYLIETEEFPYLLDLDSEEKKERAKEFLEAIEGDSSWEDAGKIESLEEWMNLDGHLGDPSEIIAEIEKEF